jgi:hypothetical protein
MFPFRSRFPVRRYARAARFKIIGYSEISLGADQIHDGFYRRVWFVKVGYDPWTSDSPGEAVNPSSIQPRHPSEAGREDHRRAATASPSPASRGRRSSRAH